jgi:uncharacterized protein
LLLTWKAKNNIIYCLSRNGSTLKTVSNGFAFARDARVLEGTLAISDLPRLHDLLTEVGGEIGFRLSGFLDERRQPMLRVEVEGLLPLACQRCLEAIHFGLEVDSLLQLVPENAELSQDELEDDTRDFLPLAGELKVADLLEDEILLALPVAPRHEKCGLPGAANAGEQVNPFAALAGLKGKANRFFWSNNMAVQQNKKSPSKRGMHRAHDFLTNPPLAVEPTTGETHLRHHISPNGFYRGKKVVKGKGE